MSNWSNIPVEERFEPEYDASEPSEPSPSEIKTLLVTEHPTPEQIVTLGMHANEHYKPASSKRDMLICEHIYSQCLSETLADADGTIGLTCEPIDGGGVRVLVEHHGLFLRVINYAIALYTRDRADVVIDVTCHDKSGNSIMGLFECSIREKHGS